jgi:hypothetical protein
LWSQPRRTDEEAAARAQRRDKLLRNFEPLDEIANDEFLQYLAVFSSVLLAYKFRRKKQLIEVETA